MRTKNKPPSRVTSGFGGLTQSTATEPQMLVYVNGQGDALPPCAEECEAATIGCLLEDSDFCAPILAREGITKNHFFDHRYRQVFLTVLEMHRLGMAADDILLVPRLKAAGVEFEPGYLDSLRKSVPSARNLEYYLEALKIAERKRWLNTLGTRACSIAGDVDATHETLTHAIEDFEHYIKFSVTSDALPPIISASNFMSEELPEQPEAIGSMLYKRSKLVVSGASKAGKTWLFIDLGTAVATGGDWLGLPTTKGRVLYLNTELTPRTFQKRLRYLCTAKGIDVATLGNLDLWHLRGKTSPWNIIIPQIRARVRDAGYTLIIVDPLYRLYGALKENSAEDMGILTNALGELAEESGAAVAIATHHSKGNQSGKEAIDRISGSGVIARDADALMDFSANEVEDAFSVSLRLRDFKPMPDFGIRWQFPMFRRDDDIDPAKLKVLTGRPRTVNIVKVLSAIANRTAENPISVSEWARLTKTVRQTLSEYLPEFRQKGWIRTNGEGSTARQFITETGIQYLKQNEGQNA